MSQVGLFDGLTETQGHQQKAPAAGQALSHVTAPDAGSSPHDHHKAVITRPTDYQPDLALLAEIARAAAVCTRCVLHKGRTRSVFSDGNPQARLMIIGEGPGQNEDETGVPFVGKAGQLLSRILEAAGIDRARDTYICNVVKCRPPGNRAPEQDEMDQCFGYLQGQIDIVRPQLILLAGATAVKAVLRTKQGITKLRGQWFDAPLMNTDERAFHGARLMPIFHPSYLLRNQSKEQGSPKWLMWQDIQEVKRALDALEK